MIASFEETTPTVDYIGPMVATKKAVQTVRHCLKVVRDMPKRRIGFIVPNGTKGSKPRIVQFSPDRLVATVEECNGCNENRDAIRVSRLGAKGAKSVVLLISLAFLAPGREIFLRWLPHDRLDQIPLYIGQAHVAARIAIRQLLVVQTQQMQDGGVPVVDMDFAFDRFEAVVVSFAIGEASLHAATGCDGESAEAFGVAAACAAAQVPFAAVLGVTNLVGSTGQKDWSQFQRDAVTHSANTIANWLHAGAQGLPH